MLRLLGLLGALLLCSACSEPPQKEIDRAQASLAAAREAGAERYASTDYAAATAAMQQAHEAVSQRDYRTALSRALAADERAQQAAKLAAENKTRARSQAEGAIHAVSNALQQLRTAIKSAETQKRRPPQLAVARKTAERVESSLQEARAHLRAERYLEASQTLKPVVPQVNEQIQALNPAPTKPKPPRR